MALFGFGKKKAQTCCAPMEESTIHTTQKTQACTSTIKILGGGCQKCNDLEAATKTALENLGIDTAIEHVTDFAVIATYGVMSTPALVVDDKVVSYGKVLKVAEAEAILKQARGL